MLTLKKEKQKSYHKQNFFIYIKTNLCYKVIDHCHYTGKYRSATHNSMLNNSSNYDHHSIIKKTRRRV